MTEPKPVYRTNRPKPDGAELERLVDLALKGVATDPDDTREIQVDEIDRDEYQVSILIGSWGDFVHGIVTAILVDNGAAILGWATRPVSDGQAVLVILIIGVGDGWERTEPAVGPTWEPIVSRDLDDGIQLGDGDSLVLDDSITY